MSAATCGADLPATASTKRTQVQALGTRHLALGNVSPSVPIPSGLERNHTTSSPQAGLSFGIWHSAFGCGRRPRRGPSRIQAKGCPLAVRSIYTGAHAAGRRHARVAELADAPGLGPGPERGVGSSPAPRNHASRTRPPARPGACHLQAQLAGGVKDAQRPRAGRSFAPGAKGRRRGPGSAPYTPALPGEDFCEIFPFSFPMCGSLGPYLLLRGPVAGSTGRPEYRRTRGPEGRKRAAGRRPGGGVDLPGGNLERERNPLWDRPQRDRLNSPPGNLKCETKPISG